MNESAKRFNEAMNAEDKFDSLTSDFMETAIELAKEISKKDPSTVTKTERKYMLSMAKFMIIGMLSK